MRNTLKLDSIRRHGKMARLDLLPSDMLYQELHSDLAYLYL
eukprot:COSAG01_NODE_65_length_29252_cov_173.296995_1_plen_41_part_00